MDGMIFQDSSMNSMAPTTDMSITHLEEQAHGKQPKNFDMEDITEEDYIDMEIATESAAMLWEAVSFKQLRAYRAESRDFEFDMSGMAFNDQTLDSPADELFYKGKLLPLHLPPRIQMVEKLLRSEVEIEYPPLNPPSRAYSEADSMVVTPYDSCNTTPYESCDVSQELVPGQEPCVSNTGTQSSDRAYTNRASTNKQKQENTSTKQAKWIRSLKKANGLAVKLKGLGSLLWKNSGSKEIDTGSCRNKYVRAMGRSGCCANTVEIHRDGAISCKDAKVECHRSSFSGSLPSRHGSGSPIAFLKRSSSSNATDIENAIQGAIAHCKQSQSPRCSLSRAHASPLKPRFPVDKASFCRG